MPSKTRIPNKVIWGLEEILALSLASRKEWGVIMERAEKTMDPVLMRAAARLRDNLAEIERCARNARAGTYEE